MQNQINTKSDNLTRFEQDLIMIFDYQNTDFHVKIFLKQKELELRRLALLKKNVEGLKIKMFYDYFGIKNENNHYMAYHEFMLIYAKYVSGKIILFKHDEVF